MSLEDRLTRLFRPPTPPTPPHVETYERGLYLPEQSTEPIGVSPSAENPELIAGVFSPGISEQPGWGFERWLLRAFAFRMAVTAQTGASVPGGEITAVQLRLTRNGVPVWSSGDLAV